MDRIAISIINEDISMGNFSLRITLCLTRQKIYRVGFNLKLY